MDDYYNQIQHLLKTQMELQSGTYKRMPNKQRLEEYNRELKKIQSMYNKDYYLINQTCTTDSKVGSTHKSFDNSMKPITIKEMTLGTTYKNRYIKFEIVTGLTLMTSIMFLGKDDNEDLVLIAIYNFENHYGTKNYKQLSYIFQKGKYILVLEPFYKMFGSGEDGIRIEDPNEIIIFDDKEWLNKFLKAESKEESFKLFHDEEDKNYDDLYKEAYKSLSIENYNTALVHFIKLKSLKPDEIKFDLKIAECYFGIPYYNKAIEKCDEIMKMNNDINNNKYYLNAFIIKIKSLIKLRKISESNELLNMSEFKDMIEKNKKEFFEINEEIKNKLKNMKGEYDFSEIYNRSQESLKLDIGEYINKKLEIKFSSIKGLSIYTKEKIQKGELIIVSKALEVSDLNKKENKKNTYMKYDNPDKGEKDNTGFNLVIKPKEDLEEILSYKLSNFPEDYNEFFYLFDGNNKNLNLEERHKNTKTDLKKIQKVIKYNSITLSFVVKEISKGLWYYPSLFNHSCIPNCHHFGFGDILIIIAINDIDPNCELFLNYTFSDMLYDERQKYLRDYYDFDCNCELCKYERNKFKESSEKKTLDEYLKKLNSHNFPDPKKENIFENILNQKEIEKMVKFVEKNKKAFSCYEKSMLYMKCALGMRQYDPYLSYDYLEKGLKYSENRNYYFEKIILTMLCMNAKLLRSDARMEQSCKKLREFLEKYFPNQKKFVDIVMEEYLKDKNYIK